MADSSIKLPLVCGLPVSQPVLVNSQYPKSQSLGFCNGYRTVVESPVHPPAGTFPRVSADRGLPKDPQSLGQPNAPSVPKYVLYENQKLQYAVTLLDRVGTFAPVESAPGLLAGPVPRPAERRAEAPCHPMILQYHLEDDTVSVNQARLPQVPPDQRGAPVVKRHRAVDPGTGTALSPTSLVAGATVKLHGLRFSVCDADDFTKSFLAGTPAASPWPDRGQQPGAASGPMGNWYGGLDASAAPSGLPVQRGPGRRRDPDGVVAFVEASLGRAPPSGPTQQYLAYAKHVLRFFCLWNDSGSLFGDWHRLRLHYYLEDDSVELVEEQEAGGRSKIFLRRAHVPAGPRSAAMEAGMNRPVELVPREILPGQHVNVHGREFFVYDMDSFTRSWLQEREGLSPSTLGPVDVAALLPRRAPVPVAELPPHNGFGQPEDSAQNCRRLVPTPPPKDQYRLLNKSKVTLGFKCLLVEDPRNKRTLLNDTERARYFYLTMFGADDSIAIYEPPNQMAGVVGGTFLRRTRVMRDEKRQTWYTSQDAYIGATLNIAGRSWRLVDADPYTLQYMENTGHSMADFGAAREELKKLLQDASNVGRFKEALTRHGSSLTHVSQDALVGAVAALEPAPVAHRAVALFRHLAPPGSKTVPLQSVLDVGM